MIEAGVLRTMVLKLANLTGWSLAEIRELTLVDLEWWLEGAPEHEQPEI